MKLAQANLTAIIVIVTAVLGTVLLAGLALSAGDRVSKSEQQLVDLAKSVGVEDLDKFSQDYKSKEIKDLVDTDKAEALSIIGSPATPTIIIDKEPLGTIPFTEDFINILNDKVATNTTGKPVLVEVYEDFNCSHCASFFPVTYLVESEFSPEEVTFERRNLPFLNEVTSYNYAYAAEAAKKQGKFYEFAKALFMQNSGLDYAELDSIQIVDGVVTNTEK